MSLFEIKCPMCNGTIWVDPCSGKVIDHRSADHQKKGLEDFIKNQKEKASIWNEKLKKAKDEQQKRKEELEEKFRKAKENIDQLKDGIDNPFQWE